MIWIISLLQCFVVAQSLSSATSYEKAALAPRDEASSSATITDGSSSTDSADSSSSTNASSDSSDQSSTSDDNSDSSSSSDVSSTTSSDDTSTNDSDSNSDSETTSTTKTSISVDPRLAAGVISLTSPVATSTTFVKSGDVVTFGWNYTSVVNTPSALNIKVACSQNRQTYTLALNQSAESSSVIWDTNKVAESNGLHLINAKYTLMIYDSSKNFADVAHAGELSPFQYTFGIYVPQTYSAWAPAAKYVNFSVQLTAPGIMTTVLAILSGTILLML